ncbi:hypothetical protein ACO0LO_24645 [Undibacterium sp. TJN25]|uniref:hypothetical protein n=1 Tax=Undibacterium sp. TJN25 TaxID=3413056 RepID=UPI003BF16E90
MIIVGTFALVWLAVVYYWRSGNRMPSVSEVAFYFIAAPIGVLIAIWLAVKAWGLATAQPEAGTAAVTESASAHAPAVDTAAEQEKELSLAILASSLRTARGSSAEELAASLASNKAAFNLDTELTDRNGYPIMSGRIQDIDTDRQSAALTEWAINAGLPGISWSDEQLRALTLGTAVLTELAQRLIGHALLADYLAARPERRDAILLPPLRLIAQLPGSWPAEQRGRAAQWLSHLVLEQGWPVEKLLLTVDSPPMPSRALAAIDRLMLDSFRQSLPCLAIVVACESHIDAATVDKWEEEGKLLDPQGNIALIPGEGAAGLLLADAQQAGQFAVNGSAKLHRLAQDARKKSVDAPGFAGEQLLADMIRQALDDGKIAAVDVALLSSDTDHRSNRMIELITAGSALFPDLDPNTQYLKVASGCGEIGAAAGIAALALAHHEVSNGAAAAICISNQDSHERAVAAISTWVEQAATETAPVTHS